MPLRRCIHPGCNELTLTSRCTLHYKQQQDLRYGGSWRTTSRQAIATHRAAHGDWCPGWKRDPHTSADLTLDHDGTVMCRACNSRKKALGDG